MSFAITHPREPARSGELNAWLAPGFSPLHVFRQMRAALRGAGGQIEQSFLYYDHASAADWASIASQPAYESALAVMPLSRAASQVFRLAGACGLDVIALGPGDGRLETRFLAHLAACAPNPIVRFFLLDISQPLLAEAYRHASATLGIYAGIAPIAILGDFHDLPQYGQLSDQNPRAPRPKVLLLLGGTFGNLDHEIRFLRDSLCGFPPGTLLLIDYPLCFAPASQPDLVRAHDPWLAPDQIAWQERVVQFWTGPFRRYLPGFLGVTVRMELSSLPPEVPGSYSIEALARVQARGAAEREFSLFRLRRYETGGLLGACRECGWDPIDGWPYGKEVDYPRALALLRKRAPPSARPEPSENRATCERAACPALGA